MIGDPTITKSRIQTALGTAADSRQQDHSNPRQAEGLLLAEQPPHPEVDEGAGLFLIGKVAQQLTHAPWPVRRTVLREDPPAMEWSRFRTRSSGGGGTPSRI